MCVDSGSKNGGGLTPVGTAFAVPFAEDAGLEFIYFVTTNPIVQRAVEFGALYIRVPLVDGSVSRTLPQCGPTEPSVAYASSRSFRCCRRSFIWPFNAFIFHAATSQCDTMGYASTVRDLHTPFRCRSPSGPPELLFARAYGPMNRPRPRKRHSGLLSRTGFARAATWLMAALVSVSLAACAASSPPILFTSDRDGDLEIYKIDPNSGEEQNLTNSGADERSPRLSSDGSMIAFLSGTEGNMSLEVMLADGTERKRLAQASERFSSYRWSPDGRRVAYVAQAEGASFLYVVNADGTEPVLLTTVPVDHVGGWSPKGNAVVFSVTTAGEQGVWVRNPDGVNEFRRTEQEDFEPVWSPDSKRIAFLSSRDGSPELYVMLADGTEQMRLTNNSAPEYKVSWSPNGKRLLFVSERDGNAEIYVTDVKGDNVTRLTTNNVRDDEPVWSPNGRRIAFVSYLDGDGDIFVMDADGGNQVRLTNNDFDDNSPSW